MALILLVDDDPIILRVVASQLRSVGHRVETAEGGISGLAYLRTEAPDLIITDVVMPDLDGWAFVRQVRSMPGRALIPVLFLTSLDSPENRIRGFKLGADDFIPKNCPKEELQARIERTLLRSQEISRTAQSSLSQNSGMMGDLAVVGVASLLTLVEMERKTGELHFQSGTETAKLWLRKGRIVDAEYKGAVAVIGVEAVYEILKFTAGQFFLTGTPVEVADRIGMPTTHLLMEGARRIDETGRQTRG